MRTKFPKEKTEKDEVNLREMFSIIGRYKWSIIFLTLFFTTAIVFKVYLMPKYYKSSIVLEVKPEESEGAGFSLGGAAAMLLGDASGGSTDLNKDIALLKTYRTNRQVLERILNRYLVRYFIHNDHYKEIEVESNRSINISNIRIHDVKYYGMRIIIQPLNNTQYQLFQSTLFSKNLIGTYYYKKMIHTEKISFRIDKLKSYTKAYTVQFLGTKRYIYNTIIKKNLMIKADKKSPFLTISYMDTIPSRGEAYLRNLLDVYTKQSIKDIKEDAHITIDSYARQLEKIENRVKNSSKKLTNYKEKYKIIEPKLQATALVKELSKIGVDIAENRYKENLIQNLIYFVERHDNIDAVASSLLELKDKPTIRLIELIQKKQLEIATLLLKYKTEHPMVINSERTIYSLKEKVLSNLENLQTTLKSKTVALQQMESNYKKKLRSAPKQEQDLLLLSRDFKVNEKLYIYLFQKKSGSELKRDQALSRFKIIENIYTPYQAEKPKKAMIVILGFISMLMLNIFFAFFREFMKKNK